MAILRRLENLMDGRLELKVRRLDYASLMDIFALTNVDPSQSFDIDFRFNLQRDPPLILIRRSLVEAKRFVSEFMSPTKEYRVRGTSESYYGGNSERHYIRAKKVPNLILLDKNGNEEDMSPAERRCMEDRLALSELKMSYTVLK